MSLENCTGDSVTTFWLWISLPHATYAVHVEGGKVDRAAPIARWTIGMPAYIVVERLTSIRDSIVMRMDDNDKDSGN